jgi:membrane protease YdiL (CAAX protease family)
MSGSERAKTIWLVVIFSVLVTALAFAAPLLGGGPSSPGLGFVVWGTAPLLVALLLRAVTRDWSDAGMRPRLRDNARWYVLCLLAYPVVMGLALLIGSLLSVASVSGFSIAGYLPITLAALAPFLLFAFFEEFGWRGYLTPKLASLGINSYVGHALVGVVWATWHLPYIRELTWVYTSEDRTTFIPRYYVVIVAFAILYGEARLVTGTIWPVVVLHGLGNTLGHPFTAEYLDVTPGREYLGSVGTGLVTIVLVVLLGVAINRWRTHGPMPTDRSP